MEFDELFQPADLASDYSTGVLTRLFGSIVPRLHAGFDDTTVTVVGGNWLESIFVVFNSFLLLGMLVVLSYTIYSMVFDTAADGKTFGERADTKYTILRSVLGVVAFVPVVGGYSLAQVALLWITLQGSALADTTWQRMAGGVLNGTPLVSGTVSTIPPGQQARIRQFGEVFDTLVTGHLCGINANSLALTLQGVPGVTPAQVSTQGDTGAIRELRSGVIQEVSEDWSLFSGNVVRGVMKANIVFGEAAGGGAYGGRNVYCGSVTVEDSFAGARNGAADIESGLMQARAEAQFTHFVETVLPDLSNAAHGVAMSLYNGERDQAALLTPARAAVYTAVAEYRNVSGNSVTATGDDVVASVHDELLEQVTLQGWMIAPVWQRGVAQTVSALETPGDTMELAVVRENRVTDFLSGRGYATNRQLSSDLLNPATARQDTWDEIAGAIRALPPPDAAVPQTMNLGGTPDVSDQVAQGLYTTVLDFFSPVATAAAGGDVADPMLQLQRQGTALATGGGVALAAGTGLMVANASIIGKASDFIFGTGEVVGGIAGSLVTVGMGVILAGMVMMIILPLVPMVYFYTAVLGWLFQIVELMFALPLAVLQLFTPSREGQLFGQQFTQVLLSCLSVMLRPFFMVAGLFLTMSVLSVGLTYLHELFSSLVFFIYPGGAGPSGGLTDVTSIGAVGNAAYGLMGLIKMLFYLGLYLLMAFLTVLYGSQLITEFGDFAMRLLGHAVNQYSQGTQIADRTTMAGGLSYAGMSRAAGGIGGNAGALSGGVRRQRIQGGASPRTLPGVKP